MSKSSAKKLAQRKRRIGGRLRVRQWSEQARPMFKARNIRYDPTDKARGLGEEVAEFEHAPQACRRSYRMIVVRKRIAVEKGQERLFTDYRYFFTITNDREHILPTIVPTAHGRCDQENLIDQLKHGVHVGAGGPRGGGGWCSNCCRGIRGNTCCCERRRRRAARCRPRRPAAVRCAVEVADGCRGPDASVGKGLCENAVAVCMSQTTTCRRLSNRPAAPSRRAPQTRRPRRRKRPLIHA